MSKRILIVDDEPNVRLSLSHDPGNRGLHRCAKPNCGSQGCWSNLQRHHFDLAILDMRMPEMDGLDLLAEMRRRGHRTPAVIITAYGDVPHAVRAMQARRDRFPAEATDSRATSPHRRARSSRGIKLPAQNSQRPMDPATQCGGAIRQCLTEAKRLLNLQDFERRGITLAEAMALESAIRRCLQSGRVSLRSWETTTGRRNTTPRPSSSIHLYEPAQQNMRRIFECFDFGSSKEPFAWAS